MFPPLPPNPSDGNHAHAPRPRGGDRARRSGVGVDRQRLSAWRATNRRQRRHDRPAAGAPPYTCHRRAEEPLSGRKLVGTTNGPGSGTADTGCRRVSTRQGVHPRGGVIRTVLRASPRAIGRQPGQRTAGLFLFCASDAAMVTRHAPTRPDSRLPARERHYLAVVLPALSSRPVHRCRHRLAAVASADARAPHQPGQSGALLPRAIRRVAAQAAATQPYRERQDPRRGVVAVADRDGARAALRPRSPGSQAHRARSAFGPWDHLRHAPRGQLGARRDVLRSLDARDRLVPSTARGVAGRAHV